MQSFGLASATLQKGVIRGPEQYIPNGLKFEEIARGSWDPKQHVEDMKTDGCDASVLYIGVAASVYNIKDRDLRLACFRAFNDWLGEFCSYDPARLIGPPLLPVEEESIQDAIDELHRNVKQWNIRTAQIPIFPWKRYYDKFYDPLWAVAQEMEMPLAFHRGLNRPFAFGAPQTGRAVHGQPGDARLLLLHALCRRDFWRRLRPLPRSEGWSRPRAAPDG